MTIPDSPVVASQLSSGPHRSPPSSSQPSDPVRVSESDRTTPEASGKHSIEFVVPKTLIAALLCLAGLAGVGIPMAYRTVQQTLNASAANPLIEASAESQSPTLPIIGQPGADASVPVDSSVGEESPQADAMVMGAPMPDPDRPSTGNRTTNRRGKAPSMSRNSRSEIPF